MALSAPLEVPPGLALLHDLQQDADRNLLALASVMELLRGCDANHTLRAGGLYALMEPVWGSLETLCGDLRSANGVFSIN